MKYFKVDKNIIYITILAFSFCLYFIKAPEEYRLNPLLMNFVYAISISIIAASIFYIFNIYLPEQKRKNIIKHNFEEQYIYFKNKSIYIFLSALEKSSNAKLWEELCDLSEFKKYFKEKYSNDQNRWDKVYDEKRVLMSFLWELFAGWSFADGYREDDIVKLMIGKI